MAQSYRISLTEEETEELVTALSAYKDNSFALLSAHQKLVRHLFDIKQGFKKPNSSSKQVNARNLGLSDTPENSGKKVDFNEAIGVSATIDVPPYVQAKGPIVVKRYKSFKRWEANPEGVSEEDYDAAQDWRYLEDLMSPEEKEAYEDRINRLAGFGG